MRHFLIHSSTQQLFLQEVRHLDSIDHFNGKLKMVYKMQINISFFAFCLISYILGKIDSKANIPFFQKHLMRITNLEQSGELPAAWNERLFKCLPQPEDQWVPTKNTIVTFKYKVFLYSWFFIKTWIFANILWIKLVVNLRVLWIKIFTENINFI